jgi:hypothetical protein
MIDQTKHSKMKKENQNVRVPETRYLDPTKTFCGQAADVLVGTT